jgi:TPR repeat protein
MRMKQVPDRVHVVKPPQDDMGGGRPAAPSGQGIEIVRTLAQISDKLKRSEAERYELLNELREYRKALTQLEDKAERAEKNVQTLEARLQTREKVETEVSQRQARFEKALKDTEEKLVTAAAGQALIDQRLKEQEDARTTLVSRLDETVTEQVRLDRQIEKVSQEKIRMLRKVERLEEITAETQDALRARALVLLTDQSTAAQAALPHMPALARSGETQDMIDLSEGQPWWRKTVQMQSVGMAAMVVAALMGGWMINQAQQPDVPQIAVLQNGGLARLDLDSQRWEPIATDAENTPSQQTDMTAAEPGQASTTLDGVAPAAGSPVDDIAPEPAVEQKPAEGAVVPQDLLNADDAQLMEALEKDPEGLASQLNDIAPEAGKALEESAPALETPAPVQPVQKGKPEKTSDLKALEDKAFRQKDSIAKTIMAEKSAGSLADRIKPDASLPKTAKALEATAFDGKAEAQHDLAAIYTAGQGGVKQDFVRAALWFREAADNGVSNAMYNLGVLHHQGLGMPKDMDKALYWYREAAKMGHPEAQYNLGIAHIEGIGTDYDPKIAATFFERAGNNGVMEAAYNLGLVYENGLLGDANPNEALLWYKIAADQGNADAKSALAQMIKTLQIGPEDVDKIVERMQAARVSKNGRKAGPETVFPTAPLAESDIKPSAVSANPVQLLTAQIQEQLKNKGDYKGAADGVMNDQTAAAIKAYQKENDMIVDGAVSDALLSHMLSVQ